MNEFLFLFELEFPSVSYMYSVFLMLGGIGFLLGLFRWWASLIWLFCPTLLFGIVFLGIQTIEIFSDLYQTVILTLGESYIWHTYISVFTGILLNIFGLFIKSLISKKLSLR
jgi:hypothetical protein